MNSNDRNDFGYGQAALIYIDVHELRLMLEYG